MKEIDLVVNKINSLNDFQLLIDTLYDQKIEFKLKKYLLYNVDDNIKTSVLNLTLDNLYKKLIISSMHSDSDKIRYLYLLDDYDKFEIISKFILDEDKINSLEFIDDTYWKDLVLYSLKDENLRKNSLSLIQNDDVKSNLLNEYDIETKLLNLIYIKDINVKRNIILNIINEKELKNCYKLDDEYLVLISNTYSINKNSLNKLISKFSAEVLLYLDNKLKKLLNYNEQELDRFLNIFDKSNLTLTKDELENICFLIEYYRYDLTTEDVYKKFLNYLEIKDSKKFMEEYNKILEFLNTEEIYKIIKYNGLKLDDIKYLTINLFNKNNYLKNLDILKIIINIYIDKNRSEYIKTNIKYIENNVKNIKEVDIMDIIDILISLDFENIYNNIITNDDIYNKLLKVLYKYKYLALTDDIGKLFELVNLSYSNNVKKNIIEKFSDYYPYIECNKDDNEFISVVYMANGYEEINYKKYLLLGKNNYFKIRNSNVTIDEIDDNIISLYNKKYSIVPSFYFGDSVKNIDIDIVVGKYFDKVNYLDRYNYDEFCILFRDIKDNSVLARIKGARKGSVVFLDEIETLIKTKLNNDDFISLCKKISDRMLIIASKANDNIESVFISVYNYSSEEDKEFLYYLDSKYVLLSGNSLTTIKKELNYKKYEVVRNKIELYRNLDASRCEYEFQMLNSVISSSSDKISFNENILYLYCGEDWYIKKTNDNKLTEFVLDASKGNKKTLDEKNICMEILKSDNN